MYLRHFEITGLLVFSSLFLACNTGLAGAAKPEDTAASLEITLSPSRAQPTAGSGGLIIGTIKNTSRISVLICEHTMTLTVPTEITQESHPSHEWAVFTALGKLNYDYDDVLVLLPGQSTHVFWNVNRSFARQPVERSEQKSWSQQLGTQIGTELGYMFFEPATYKFSVQAKFWPIEGVGPITKESLKESEYKLPGYQNTIAEIAIPIKAPITVVLFGSTLGGLAAYLLRKPSAAGILSPTSPRGSRATMVAATLRNALAPASAVVGAMLLACMVTILLSRMAETEFPIRVSVSDVWGAMAVGFLGAYSGGSVLGRLLGQSPSSNPSSRATEAAQSGGGSTQSEPSIKET